jgi:hypothetical protein
MKKLKNIVLFFVLMALGATISRADDHKSCTKEGHFKLKVVKALKMDVSPASIDLGTLTVGETKYYTPNEIMTFTITGQDNANIQCTASTNQKTDNGVTIDATFSTLPNKLNCNGVATVECKITKAVVSSTAPTGSRSFCQKITVEYTDL